VADYGGTNLVAVKVDASDFEGWFYEGAGIYRHVWLVKTAPVAIAPDGIFVYSRFKDNVPDGYAEVNIQTRLLNSQTTDVDAMVKGLILDPDGNRLPKFRRQSAWGLVEKRSGADRFCELAGALVARIAQTLQAGHDGGSGRQSG